MPTKTRHQIREQENRGQPATPPTSLPLDNRRPRRAAARGPTPAPEAPPDTKPQRGRRRKATPALSIEEPSAESASVSAAESATETVPNNEQGSAVVTESPERDNAVYQNRENPTVSLHPTLVPEDVAVQSPRENVSVSLIPALVPEDVAVQSPRENVSVSLIPTLVPANSMTRSVRRKPSVSVIPNRITEDEGDSMDSPLDPHPPPKERQPPNRAWRRKNTFTYGVHDSHPIISRDPVEPEAPQNTLHLLVTGPDGERTMAFTLPATAANAIIDDLTNKYKLVTDAPKLTLDAGKREAPINVDLEDTRPAQRPRFENAPRLDNALKGKVSHPNWSHLLGEYYQQRQDKPGHTQHYRMVEPRYDENGMMAWPMDDDSNRRFIPIVGDADDSDLDTELDDASSSFKENIPVILEDDAVENIEDSEPSDALVNGSGAGAHGPEEGAIVLRENDGGDENVPDAPAVQNSETPRSRW